MEEQKIDIKPVRHIDTEILEVCGEIRENPVLVRAAALIRAGKLVAFPTETVYGIGGDATDADAARRIYAAKGRPSDNPLIIHLSDAKNADAYCVTTPLYWKLTAAFSPGPLTMVMQKKGTIPNTVTGGGDTVAVRIPSNPVARELIRLSGVPIAAPSANLSGHPSPTSAAHVIRDLSGRIDMILSYDDAEIGLESTVVALDGDTVTILRPGGITYEQLCAELGEEYVNIDRIVTEKVTGSFKPRSPGMKYKHYAPRAQVILLDGTAEAVLAFMKEKKHDARTGILCYEEDSDTLSGEYTVCLGSRADVKEQAHRLFGCLRRFDELPIDTVYGPVPNKNGVGLAVYNRLMKASGFCVQKI